MVGPFLYEGQVGPWAAGKHRRRDPKHSTSPKPPPLLVLMAGPLKKKYYAASPRNEVQHYQSRQTSISQRM